MNFELPKGKLRQVIDLAVQACLDRVKRKDLYCVDGLRELTVLSVHRDFVPC